MTSINNILVFLNENWAQIVILFGLVIALAVKIGNFWKKSDEEKLQIAKTQISEVMLKLTSDAEEQYEDLKKSGAIKRSQVLSKIYSTYPILSKVASQDKILEWIDKEIDASLKILRERAEAESKK